MSGDFANDIIARGLLGSFMDSIHTWEALYAMYDPHALGLLGMADFKQRQGDIRRLGRFYTISYLRINDVERLFYRNQDRIKKFEIEISNIETKIKKLESEKSSVPYTLLDEIMIYRERKITKESANFFNLEAYEKWLDLILRVESWFAKYRNIALTQAFKQFEKKASDVIGQPEGTMIDAKKRMSDAKDRMRSVKDRFPLTQRSHLRSDLENVEKDYREGTKIVKENLTKEQIETLAKKGLAPEDLFG